MKHHQKKMLIKARRIGAIILMCLLVQQLGLHNSQSDEQKLSPTTFVSLIDNGELFHGERTEASPTLAPSYQLKQRILSPPAIVTSLIPAQSVISTPSTPLPLVKLMAEPLAHHEQRTMVNDNNRSPPSESTIKASTISNTAADETVSKLNHRVQRDQETGLKAAALTTITTVMPHSVLVTNDIRTDQIYISDPAESADFKATKKANIKKGGKSILEWLKDKHRLKHTIGQTVLNEIETSKIVDDRVAAGGHKIHAISSLVAAKVPTQAPESIGADKLSIILMEDRLLADSAKSASKSRQTSGKRTAPMITSVLSAPTTSLPAIAIDKRHTMDPCATDHKALCFSKFLFGDSRSSTGESNLVIASKTDLKHLISGEKASKTLPSGTNAETSQRFMHFG